MKKLYLKIIIGLLGLLILGYLYQVIQYRKPVIVEMNQVMELNSSKDENAGWYLGPQASFGFDGTMEFTVTDATTYDSNTDANISEEDMITSNTNEAYKLLILDCTLENIDAIPSITDHMNIGFLSLSTREAFGLSSTNGEFYPSGEIAYFSEKTLYELTDNAVSNEFHFMVEVGETLNFKVGYWIPEALYEDGELVLKMGITPDCKYGIAIK